MLCPRISTTFPAFYRSVTGSDIKRPSEFTTCHVRVDLVIFKHFFCFPGKLTCVLKKFMVGSDVFPIKIRVRALGDLRSRLRGVSNLLIFQNSNLQPHNLRTSNPRPSTMMFDYPNLASIATFMVEQSSTWVTDNVFSGAPESRAQVVFFFKEVSNKRGKRMI